MSEKTENTTSETVKIPSTVSKPTTATGKAYEVHSVIVMKDQTYITCDMLEE